MLREFGRLSIDSEEVVGNLKKQSIGLGAILFVSTLAVSSCAAVGAQPAPETSTAAATSASAVSPTPSTEPSISASSRASSSSSPSSGQSSAAADSKTPETVATEKAGSPLTLADFFRPSSDWTENRFDVADKSDVSGISTEISNAYEDGADTLELRLANNFDQLSFRVGQANNSTSSEQTLIVKVLGNGKQLDVYRVPFNTVQEVSIPIKNVNAVKVRIYLDSEKRRENGSAVAVISNVTVE